MHLASQCIKLIIVMSWPTTFLCMLIKIGVFNKRLVITFIIIIVSNIINKAFNYYFYLPIYPWPRGSIDRTMLFTKLCTNIDTY